MPAIRLTRGYFRTAHALAPSGSTTAAKLADTAIAVMFDRRADDVLVLAVRRWP